MVLGALVRLLISPMFVRMAAVALSAVTAFVLGLVVVRVLRRQMVEGSNISEDLGPETGNALYPYTAVIQQLKQQKFALENEKQVQQRRAKTSEHITASMISHLPCGVLFVAPNGLIKQANAAARRMLGFASPLGMSVGELFRDAVAVSGAEAGSKVAEAFHSALQSKAGANHFESSYFTPGSEERMLKFTLIPMCAPAGEMLGVASVISDESATADSQRARVLHSETSAEMALELRTSLATIREWAEKMRGTTDREQTRGLAEDISAEAERLEKMVGGFLAGSREDQALGARA
jgi:nitrogen fixation/metabolism regulation signal transduction histidine kinase